MSRRLNLISVCDARLALVSILLTGVAVVPMARAAISSGDLESPSPQIQPVDPDQVDFAANSVAYDETGQIITAEGDVEISQNGKIVRAQKVIYNLPKDTVEAVGDVVMLEPSGDVHFADRAELERKLKNAYVQKLRSVLADGSRLTADEGQHVGTKTEMKNATYTPCEPCKADPEKPALWQIAAEKVTHDEAEHSISYENAKFEVYGVPVMYAPYFSHSDGTIKQKSGFLPPKLSLSSQLGFGLTSKYYGAISPSEDATIGARVFSKNTPQFLGEYRKRFDNAEMQFESSATYSNSEDEFRGHLFGEGLWDIDSKWRAGFKTQLTSDDTYLNEYDLSNENVLENQLYLERFEDRDYFVARALAFQDVRVSDRSADQPNILPEMQANFLGDPNGLLGGRWSADFSSLNLLRKGNGQDVFRGSGELAWQRHDILPVGLVNTFNISARGDAYEISDRDEDSIVGGSGGADAFRVYPLIHDVLSYPVSRNVGNAQIVIEPTVAFTASTNTKNDTDIPNEDSQDVQIDATNIFDANRFPGIDRVEDGAHVTYGARTGAYMGDGSKGEIFLGQSYRLDNSDNPFPEGSGLSEQESDLVGQIVAQYKDLYNLNYRFQLGSENFQSERHEIDGFATFGDLSLSATYLYARNLEGTDLQESRQQVYGAAAYKLDEEWTLTTAARYDLSTEDEGLRYTDLGINYAGQCFNILTRARRTFTDEDTGDNGTEVTVQIGLKNLGSFGTAQ